VLLVRFGDLLLNSPELEHSCRLKSNSDVQLHNDQTRTSQNEVRRVKKRPGSHAVEYPPHIRQECLFAGVHKLIASIYPPTFGGETGLHTMTYCILLLEKQFCDRKRMHSFLCTKLTCQLFCNNNSCHKVVDFLCNSLLGTQILSKGDIFGTVGGS